MASGNSAVDIEGGVVVDCTEVDEYLLTLPCCGDADLALIPDGRNEVLIAYTGELALGAVGHGNLVGEALALVKLTAYACVAEVELVGPSAVEVKPVSALKLWARILGTRNVGLCHTGNAQGKSKEDAKNFHFYTLFYNNSGSWINICVVRGGGAAVQERGGAGLSRSGDGG